MDKSPVKPPGPAETKHLSDCTGNGSEPCWQCGGDGFTEEWDEGSLADEYVTCSVCDGDGYFRCPGCKEDEL